MRGSLPVWGRADRSGTQQWPVGDRSTATFTTTKELSMLLLGLLLLGGAAAFTGLLIADNRSGGPTYSVVLSGHTIATMNALEIFLSGLTLALIFCIGLAMTGVGGRLARRRRVTLRRARRLTRRTSGSRSDARTAPAARTRTGRQSRWYLFGH
jgi:hypothetical protein